MGMKGMAMRKTGAEVLDCPCCGCNLVEFRRVAEAGDDGGEAAGE